MYSIISAANSDSFTSSFLVWVSLFLHFLVSVARTSKTVLNKSGHPRLFPNLRGNAFSVSPLSKMLAMDMLYMAFIMLRYVPSLPTLWRVFVIDAEFHQKLFLLVLRWSYDFLFFNKLIVIYHIFWLVNIEPSLQPWNKSHLVTVYDSFNVLLDSVC